MTYKLDLGHQRLRTLPCSNEAALREQGVWMVHVTEPREGCCINFKILAGGRGDLLVLW